MVPLSRAVASASSLHSSMISVRRSVLFRRQASTSRSFLEAPYTVVGISIADHAAAPARGGAYGRAGSQLTSNSSPAMARSTACYVEGVVGLWHRLTREVIVYLVLSIHASPSWAIIFRQGCCWPLRSYRGALGEGGGSGGEL